MTNRYVLLNRLDLRSWYKTNIKRYVVFLRRTGIFTQGGFEKLVDMKKKRNPRLKVMISVGGATAGSWAFNEVMSSPDDLLAFVNNVVIFLREWDFDGLDIDWEFPERPGRLAMLARVSWSFICQLRNLNKTIITNCDMMFSIMTHNIK